MAVSKFFVFKGFLRMLFTCDVSREGAVCLRSTFLLQQFITISADDKDDSANGPRFIFSLPPEIIHNPNFTLRDNRGLCEDSLYTRVQRNDKGKLMANIMSCNSIFINFDRVFSRDLGEEGRKNIAEMQGVSWNNVRLVNSLSFS